MHTAAEKFDLKFLSCVLYVLAMVAVGAFFRSGTALRHETFTDSCLIQLD